MEGIALKYYLETVEDMVYAFEADGSQDSLIRANMTLLTSEQLTAVRARQSVAQIPAEVPMWKAREVLIEDGLLSRVNAIIDALPSPTKEKAASRFEFATVVARTDEFTRMLAAALPLSAAQLDDLFLRASKK